MFSCSNQLKSEARLTVTQYKSHTFGTQIFQSYEPLNLIISSPNKATFMQLLNPLVLYNFLFAVPVLAVCASPASARAWGRW